MASTTTKRVGDDDDDFSFASPVEQIKSATN